MADKSKRWVQRFQVFEKAMLRLKEAVEKPDLNELERNGLVQRFEFTLEMAWKTLKDFLIDQEFEFKPSPKETIRLAQQYQYIDCARELLDGFQLRNELSHDYSGEKFENYEQKFRNDIYPAIEKLYAFFQSQLNATK